MNLHSRELSLHQQLSSTGKKIHFISSLGYCQYKSFKVSENLSLLSLFSVSCLFYSEQLGAMRRLLGSLVIKKDGLVAHRPGPSGAMGEPRSRSKRPAYSGPGSCFPYSWVVLICSMIKHKVAIIFTFGHQGGDVLLSSQPAGLKLQGRNQGPWPLRSDRRFHIHPLSLSSSIKFFKT